MLRMMLRPRWIAALLLALTAAGTFAALAQWQIERAATEAIVKERPTEQLFPIADQLQPGVATPQSATGQRFETAGTYQAGDSVIVPNRIRNVGDRTSGWWVVAHFVTDRSIDVPVVVGWAPTEPAARAAIADFDATIRDGSAPTAVTGRFLPSDAPAVPKGDPQTVTAVSVGHLINIWQNVSTGGAYFGYLISEEPASGLDPVSTPAPEQQAQLNWLNVFYGVEWTLFAGFAVYLWWRLVKDAVEREREALGEAPSSADAQETGN